MSWEPIDNRAGSMVPWAVRPASFRTAQGTMLRFLVSAILVATAPAVAAIAEVVVEEHAEGVDGLTVFHMTVTPAAEPRPALKHRMWLRPHELRPGNAAAHYRRCSAENALSGAWRRVRDKFGEPVWDWYDHDIPIEQLPLEQVREAAATFETIVNQIIQPGSRCRECDWGLELEDQRGPEIISFLLPEFQQSRSICRAIALCTRLAIAERRYDDAIEHLRMNYRLGRDVGQEKILVCNLIGIAIAGTANSQLIDLIAAPDSPNLYWALAELPTPLVDCRESIRLEMTLGPRMFPALLEAETTEHSDQEWARLMAEGIKTFQEIGEMENIDDLFGPGFSFKPSDPVVHGLLATGVSLVGYSSAKQRLIESAMEPEQVKAMAVGQVMLVDAAREYRRIADEYEKWWYVPYPEARIRMHEADQVLESDRSPVQLGRTIARILLPAVQACRMAQARMGWQKNALLVIEALRMHAAIEGEFPQSLIQIYVVPVPLNPITREPYVYRRDGDMAVLELPLSDGMPGVSWRFDIKLAEE